MERRCRGRVRLAELMAGEMAEPEAEEAYDRIGLDVRSWAHTFEDWRASLLTGPDMVDLN